MPDSIKVTNEILLRGALIFAIMDVVFVAILHKLIKQEDLIKMKWKLVIVMALFFTGTSFLEPRTPNRIPSIFNQCESTKFSGNNFIKSHTTSFPKISLCDKRLI